MGPAARAAVPCGNYLQQQRPIFALAAGFLAGFFAAVFFAAGAFLATVFLATGHPPSRFRAEQLSRAIRQSERNNLPASPMFYRFCESMQEVFARILVFCVES
jgi:hypothetical protein